MPALIVPQALALDQTVGFSGLENCLLPLWPLAIACAVARHQLFDIPPFVRRSLTYLLSAAILALAYALAVTVTETLLASQTRVPGIVATVLVAFAFVPVRDRVKHWLDARYFRVPYRSDELIAGFSKTAQENVDPQALMQAYLETLDQALAPTHIAIFLDQEGPKAVAGLGGMAPEPSMRDRAFAKRASQALPLAVQDHVLGHVMVGPRKSGLAYTETDLALLMELTQLLALWLVLFGKVRHQAQELEALRRSEAMQGQFLNIVSHELKIPLSVILSSLNLLERSEGSRDSKTVNHLNRIRRSLTHLTGLVGDLLNAGQLESGQFQLRTRDLDLERIAQETIAEMRPLAEQKAHRLSTAIAPELPCIRGDEARLAQVFRNLIHNAIRYTPANGRIHLSLGLDDLQHVRCEIRDNGPGVAPAAMQHLFRRFGRVHEEASDREQGVGLGLFISKAIVEAHAGRIGVQSRPGEGSTFWFTLPPCVERELAEHLPASIGPS